MGSSVSETSVIQAGVGVSYFVTERRAVYAGLNPQHISNAGLNASQDSFALNDYQRERENELTYQRHFIFNWFAFWERTSTDKT